MTDTPSRVSPSATDETSGPDSPPATGDERYCEDIAPYPLWKWRCTRAKGHLGHHAVHDAEEGFELHRWASRSPSADETQPLTAREAREILGHGPGTGWPGYLTHHPDCSPPKDCMCMLFAIQNRLRAIAESLRSPSSPVPSSEMMLTERELQLTILAVMDALDANGAFLDADPTVYERIIEKLQRMKTFSLGQAWVSRATAEDAPDVE